MTPPTRATMAGRAYLDLRNKARQDRRPVDELMQLYVLESFLARMSLTQAADRFVLKGGLLLAVFGERRPTRDIDLQAQAIGSDPSTVRAAISDIAATNHRGTRLAPLSNVLDGYGAIGQQRWETWRRKQRLDDRLPSQFSEVVMAVVAFADPAISGMSDGQSWDPATAGWS
jgi:hypothetical protein